MADYAKELISRTIKGGRIHEPPTVIRCDFCHLSYSKKHIRCTKKYVVCINCLLNLADLVGEQADIITGK